MRLGLATTTGILAVGSKADAAVCTNAFETPISIESAVNLACGVGLEQFPYSPVIVSPFRDTPDNQLPIPQPLAPGYRRADGTLVTDPLATDLWSVRMKNGGNVPAGTTSVPGPGVGAQDSHGDRGNGAGLPRAGTHQMYPGLAHPTRWDGKPNPVTSYPDPILYHIRIKMAQHRVTSSPVLPIAINRKNGTVVPANLPGGATATQNGTDNLVFKSGKPTYNLPMTTIYGFNGIFPGSMINAEYGKPTLVRFENDLDKNDACLPRYDYGAPDWAFLTHLHNGHTAPESDGNPHHMTVDGGGYRPGHWCDNLYLHYPAGNDPNEKQSFLWFHDHRMHHTGANVYKGLVGLMPLYDPAIDDGDETNASNKPGHLKLPGVRTNNADGSFKVDYDIPMAFYDCVMDDGVTPHFDIHQTTANCGTLHPEWWGQHFYRHYPGSGFVGDVFTVNGIAFPVLKVKARKYRFRFLGASVARCYELSLRRAPNSNVGSGQTGIMAYPGQQGQWNFASATVTKGKTTINRVPGTLIPGAMLQIASEGGLMEHGVYRDSIQIWPAKRREVVIDFSQFKGETIYLTNTMQMPDGKKPLFAPAPGEKFDANYAVPLVKIIVENTPSVADNSDTMLNLSTKTLRPMPVRRTDIAAQPVFNLKSGNPLNPQDVGSGETKWLINDMEFSYDTPLHVVTEDSPEIWTVANLGGGWTHPFHIHQEEHQIISRDGVAAPHVEDGPPAIGKEDVLALEPGETIQFYRNFRTFCGKYVAHCHNLAHEDHNMMFGWTIRPKVS